MADNGPKITVPPSSKDKSPKDKPGRPTGTANRNSPAMAKIESGLKDLTATAALGFQVAGNDVAAVVFATRGPKLAEAWTELARQNIAVRNVLLKAMEGGAWAGVIISTLGIALPLMQDRGIIPPTMPHPFMLNPEEIAQINTLRTMREKAFQDIVKDDNAT